MHGGKNRLNEEKIRLESQLESQKHSIRARERDAESLISAANEAADRAREEMEAAKQRKTDEVVELRKIVERHLQLVGMQASSSQHVQAVYACMHVVCPQ